MQPRTKKYILDIESAIGEIEDLVMLCDKQYVKFENNPLAIRSLERLLEIIGEATKKALDSNMYLVIGNSQRIISLRNRLAHAYDSIQPSIIWSIALKDVPKLKTELEQLKQN